MKTFSEWVCSQSMTTSQMFSQITSKLRQCYLKSHLQCALRLSEALAMSHVEKNKNRSCVSLLMLLMVTINALDVESDVHVQNAAHGAQLKIESTRMPCAHRTPTAAHLDARFRAPTLRPASLPTTAIPPILNSNACRYSQRKALVVAPPPASCHCSASEAPRSCLALIIAMSPI